MADVVEFTEALNSSSEKTMRKQRLSFLTCLVLIETALVMFLVTFPLNEYESVRSYQSEAMLLLSGFTIIFFFECMRLRLFKGWKARYLMIPVTGLVVTVSLVGVALLLCRFMFDVSLHRFLSDPAGLLSDSGVRHALGITALEYLGVVVPVTILFHVFSRRKRFSFEDSRLLRVVTVVSVLSLAGLWGYYAGFGYRSMVKVRLINSGRNLPRIVAFSLHDRSQKVRLQAIKKLSDIGGAQIVNPMIAALEDKSPEVRWVAARTLGKMHQSEVIQPLITAMGKFDTDFFTRFFAMYSLETITGKDFGTDPGKWQVWWDENKDKYQKEK